MQFEYVVELITEWKKNGVGSFFFNSVSLIHFVSVIRLTTRTIRLHNS